MNGVPMDLGSDKEFIALLEQMEYDAGWPWERWYINHCRRKEGRSPLRNEPSLL